MTLSTGKTRLLNREVRRVLEGAPIAHLATVLPDGSPHRVPLWIDALGEQVVSLTGPDSRKARNLRRDPRLAISLATRASRSRSRPSRTRSPRCASAG